MSSWRGRWAVGALFVVSFAAACGARSPLNLAASDTGDGGTGIGFGPSGGSGGGAGRGGTGRGGTGRGGSSGSGSGRGGSGGASGSGGSGGNGGNGGSAGVLVDSGTCTPLGEICGREGCCEGSCNPEGYCQCAPTGTLCGITRPCCRGFVCSNGHCLESCSLEGGYCSRGLPCCDGLDCGSDGICSKPRCEVVTDEAIAFVTQHQKCTTLADCTEFSNSKGPLLPGEFCCAVPLNGSTSVGPLISLIAEWQALGCGVKEACCTGDASLDCVGGRCVWR